MNTLEIDTLLKKHPHSRPVFKEIYARNRLPRLLNVPPVEATTIVQKFVLLLVEHFAEALTATINVVTYAEFDNVIEIDRNRQVLFDYSA